MDNSIDNNLSVIPEFTKVKNVVLEQYYSSQIALTNYGLKPDLSNEQTVRSCLNSLSLSLSLKSHYLDDSIKEEKEMKEYFRYFLSNPSMFYGFHINAIFSICHLIMERLGYFKVESESLDKENVYKEV